MLFGSVIRSPSQIPHFKDGLEEQGRFGGRPLGLFTSDSSVLAVEEGLSTPPPARFDITSLINLYKVKFVYSV